MRYPYKPFPQTGLSGGGLVGPDVLAVQQNPAVGGLQQTVQVLHQSGLTGTGMANNADKLAPFHTERYIIQRRVLERGSPAIDMFQIFYL